MSAGEVDALDRARRCPDAVTILVDAFDRERRGGTGQLADWTLAAAIARERPVVLAGGLTAGTVGEAIRQVRPWAVDVSSGVERAPGIKDPDRLASFFAQVAAAAGEDA
jgi:phosphoribosylanthranilate isomerase